MYLVTGLLAGCAATGQRFERVPLESISLGKTTPSEIVATVGQPRETRQIQIGGRPALLYTYLDIEARGVVGDRARSANFTFSDGRLVAFEFRSDFAGESTDFDEAAARTIAVGKSTRGDVERVLGKPSGGAIFPVLATPAEVAALYVFIRGASVGPVFRKSALYRYNEQGTVVFAEVKNEEVKR
jgi:hypothetical protein